MLHFLTHNYLTAWRVRQYWRIRSGTNTNRAPHLPCMFCLHDLDANDDGAPIWMWCIRPSRDGQGCDWGNQ